MKKVEVAIKLIAALSIVLMQVSCGVKQKSNDNASNLLSIEASNKRPISNLTDFGSLFQYAANQGYYKESQAFKDGDKVYFSAAYEANGSEEGQSRGEVVKGSDGEFYYRQTENVTMQLLLPPGLSWNNGTGDGLSLWNLTQFDRLVKYVAFSNGLETQTGSSDSVHYSKRSTGIYSNITANEVDFEGGTAGGKVNHQNVLEVSLQKTNSDESVSKVI